MNVAELIDYLGQFDPDTLVLHSGHDVDLGQPYIALDNPELELVAADDNDLDNDHRYNPAPFCAKCGGPCQSKEGRPEPDPLIDALGPDEASDLMLALSEVIDRHGKMPEDDDEREQVHRWQALSERIDRAGDWEVVD